MQLIFETESETHISTNMALIDKDSINEKFSDNIVEKLSSISNGNKENLAENDKIETKNGVETNDSPKKEVNGDVANSKEVEDTLHESSHILETNLEQSEDINGPKETVNDLKSEENKTVSVEEEVHVENGIDESSNDITDKNYEENDSKESSSPINTSNSTTEKNVEMDSVEINQPEVEAEPVLDKENKDEEPCTRSNSTETNNSTEENKNIEESINNVENNLCESVSETKQENTPNKATEIMDVDESSEKTENEVQTIKDCVEDLEMEENGTDDCQVINTVISEINESTPKESITDFLREENIEDKIELSGDKITENCESEQRKEIVNVDNCDKVDGADKIENQKEDATDDVCEVDSNTKSEKVECKSEPLSLSSVSETVSQKNLNSAEDAKPKKTRKITLDILSDDEDIPVETKKADVTSGNNNQSINIEDDDDDIMLIDDSSAKAKVDSKIATADLPNKSLEDEESNINKHETTVLEDKSERKMEVVTMDIKDAPSDKETTNEEKLDEVKKEEENVSKPESPKSLLPKNFLSTCKMNLAEMTRNDLEEFCILKIVESVLDRGNLGEIKSQLKKMAHTIEKYKNETKSLTKQNHALQVVLKSVQEEVRKNPNSAVTPLKISRSVGIQVIMADSKKKKAMSTNQNTSTANLANTNQVNKAVRGVPTIITKSPKPDVVSQQIPVPRLVPASSGAKPNTSSLNQIPNKPATAGSPATKTPPTKKPLKRPSNVKMNSDTVDLTDDEPPPKLVARGTTQSVRVIPSQSLMAPQRAPIGAVMNHPRQVYIPISGGQAQSVRPGQTFMLRAINSQNIRQRNPALHNRRTSISTHPAPLPEITKQCQPPNWKLIPPAPEIKLSKVENGIVISWKLDNYREDNHENIASYQIYAYQETSSPPSTNLWKKIGDVKALPLPMACTLTQFISGYKYYFAVRAVDARSRIGPFSLPGNIMLVNK